MKLKYLKETINKEKLYRLAFNEACNLLVINGFYKSTYSAENSILMRIKKTYDVRKMSHIEI
jgi:hypothetical protein